MANGKRSKGNGILAFFFLLPLIAIIIYFIANSTQVIILDNVAKITVSAPGKDSVVFNSDEDIDFYVKTITGSLSISSAMRNVKDEIPVYITCSSESNSIRYKFYPSLNLSGCLLIAPEGKLYVLENETAKQLLLRPEFDYLYSDYFLPKLSVVSGENVSEVLPIESDWSYYKSDDVAYSYTPSEYASGEEVYTILKGLDNTLTFTPNDENLPFEMTDVSYITSTGVEYNIKDISQLDLSVDTMITVSFTAKWSSRNGARAFGEAKYKFNLLYDIPARLELDVKDYVVGDVIEVHATNLNDNETIEFDSLIDIPQVKFDIIDEDKGIALLPIPRNTVPGSYTIKLKTGADEVIETITVTVRDGGVWTPIEASTEEYNQKLSPEKLSDFYKSLREIATERPDVNYFDYAEMYLRAPVSASPRFKFGQKINLGVADISGDSGERTCEGLVYELSEGTTVRSAQAGEVVFSGELAPTGNTVVVYHGYGIYTYYFHLDTVNVREGYVLNHGEVLGTAGSSGFTAGKTALNFSVSIDGVFVDPEWFFEE